jgi:hypothetical protein
LEHYFTLNRIGGQWLKLASRKTSAEVRAAPTQEMPALAKNLSPGLAVIELPRRPALPKPDRVKRRPPESGFGQQFGPIGLEEGLHGLNGSQVSPQPSLLQRLRYLVVNESFPGIGD